MERQKEGGRTRASSTSSNGKKAKSGQRSSQLRCKTEAFRFEISEVFPFHFEFRTVVVGVPVPGLLVQKRHLCSK